LKEEVQSFKKELSILKTRKTELTDQYIQQVEVTEVEKVVGKYRKPIRKELFLPKNGTSRPSWHGGDILQ
jgi:hypothetical protein